MTTNKIGLLTVLLFVFSKCLSQQPDSTGRKFNYNQTISVSFLGPSYFYSVNHAKVIKQFTGSTLIRQINLSFYREKFNGIYYNSNLKISNYLETKNYYSAGYSLVNYFGRQDHHLILGLGQTAYLNRRSLQQLNSGIKKETNFNLYLFGVIGYSYRNPNRRFYMNISMYPLFYHYKDATLPFFPMPGLTFGYNYAGKYKIHFLNNYLDTKTRTCLSFSLDQGFGITSLKTHPFGSGEGFAMNNRLSIYYMPARLYFKAFIGNTSYFNSRTKNYPDSSSSELRQISGTSTTKITYPFFSFLNYGAGIGLTIYDRNLWKCSLEGSVGIFIKKNLNYSPHTSFSDINISNNIDYHLSLPMNPRWFASSAVIVERSLSGRISIRSGLNYSFTKVETNLMYLQMKDYFLSVGLGYKL